MSRKRTMWAQAVLLTACVVARTAMGDAQWTGGAVADDQWSTSGNWAGSAPPANPEGGTVFFGNDDLGNVNGLDQDWTVAGLQYTNDSPTAAHTTDLSNNTLVVRSALWVGRNVDNSAATIQNGTLQLGAPSYQASVYVGYNSATELDRDQTNHALTVVGVVDGENVGNVFAGSAINANYYAQGTLDLSGATLTGPDGPNTLTLAGDLQVGRGIYNARAGIGRLTFPSSLRGLDIGGSLYCGEGLRQAAPRTWSEGVIDFGVGSSLTNLVVGGDFYLASRGAIRSELANLPAGAVVRIGQSGAPVAMHLARANAGSYASDAAASVGVLTLTNRFTAFLTQLIVGESSFHVHGSATGILDVAEATVQIGETPDKMTGLDLFRVGTGKGGYGEIRLPSAITEISVGKFILGSGGEKLVSGGSTYYGASAVLDITSNSLLTAFTATNGYYQAGEQASGRIGYRDGADFVDYLPPGITFTVGRPDAYVPMHLVTWSCSYGGNPGTTGILSIVNGSFTGYLSELLVGYNTSYRGNGYGLLDLSSASVQIGDTPNQVKVPRLIVAGGRNGATPSQTGGMETTLRLPATITNMTVGELQIGVGGGAYCPRKGSKGTLEFAAGSQLAELTVTNSFMMGAYHAEYGRILGWPAGDWRFNLGGPATRIPLFVGHKNHEGAYNLNTKTTGILAPTNATFTAYLTSLVLGVCSNSSSYGPVHGELDLRASTLDTLDVSGPIVIGESLATYSGLSEGYLRLPAGTARAQDLLIGSVNVASRTYGEVELHGTEFTISNQLRIFHVGLVTNHLDGAAGGIWLTSTDTGKFDIQDGGLMHIVFARDPQALAGDHYWGLKMNGDQQAFFAALQSAGKLIWDTSALSPRWAAAVGIQYDEDHDFTYVGIPRRQGSVILFR